MKLDAISGTVGELHGGELDTMELRAMELQPMDLQVMEPQGTDSPAHAGILRGRRPRQVTNQVTHGMIQALTHAATQALAASALVGLALAAQSRPAAADLRLCNNTSSRVGISVGYKENEGWTTEGWWNLNARSCETLLRGALVARFYYIYAVDYDRGGEWSGQAFMCTRDKEFTIKGTDDCLARGFDRTGFFEVDTAEQPSWTVQLTESAEQAPVQSRSPGPPPPASSPATAGRPAAAPPPAPRRN
jgi:uncharacterized membrane protein